MGHSLFAPSAAARWMTCPGSVALSMSLPNKSSEAADEGTAAHELAAMCLTGSKDAKDFIGQAIEVNGKEFVVDAEMAMHVGGYVDRCRSIGEGGLIFVETRVDFSRHIDVPEQTGTSDFIAAFPDTGLVVVRDLKYGMGVKVFAQDNPQGMIYALGSLDELALVGEFDRVRIEIDQPRLNHMDAWEISVADLLVFADKAKAAAQHALGCMTLGIDEVEDLCPGEKQCKFCPAKGDKCPAQTRMVMASVADDFVDLTRDLIPQLASAQDLLARADEKHLSRCMNAVSLVEDWCRAVRARTESLLLAGTPVPGYKIVRGKNGHRKWSNEQEAEKAFKGMRFKENQMYDFKLISPTTAEKLAKQGEIGPRQWPKLQALITQSEGALSVTYESDTRPAVSVSAKFDEFDDLTEHSTEVVNSLVSDAVPETEDSQLCDLI